jgi:hypothetical protein
MQILSTDLSSVTFNHGEIHHLSVEFLRFLHESDVSVGDGALASALTLGRLMSPVKLTEEAERQFLEALMSFVGAFFVEGEA